MDKSRQHAQEAMTLFSKPFHVKGIRGETILSYIPNFDIIEGIVPEYLHCGILGVPRQFAKLWFSSKNHEKPYYIGLAKEDVNKRLKFFRPPSYVSRPTRDLDDSKFWKGHEWYWWTFAYSIVALKGILPPKYLKHWMLFAEALFIMCQETIPKSRVHTAMEMMVLFIKGTEELYGLENCSFNLHLCGHLGDVVLNWGSLFESSAFLYEDYNQVLLKTVHSSKGVLQQVINLFRTMRSIPALLATPAGQAVSGMGVAGKKMFLSTNDSVHGVNSNCSAVVLSPRLDSISDAFRLAFASNDIILERSQNVLFFEQIIVNEEVFQSKEYKLAKKKETVTPSF